MRGLRVRRWRVPALPDPSGLAISSRGRLFLGFPRHADDHNMPCLAEIVRGPDNGTEAVPFPNLDYVLPHGRRRPPSTWLVSPHGMVFDAHDTLWVIDNGKRASLPGIPEGAAKAVAFDIEHRCVIATFVVPSSIVTNDAHLNDIRADSERGWIYLTNSGFGPHYSLVVIHMATGRCREFLKNKACTSPEPGFMTFLEGAPKRLALGSHRSDFPTGGADGIALSENGSRLYWTPLSGRGLYSIRTRYLHEAFDADDGDVERWVEYHGQRPTCDGIAEGPHDSLFFGSYQERALLQRNAKGGFRLVVQDDDLLGWPDSLVYHDGRLYVTLGQWDRSAAFNHGTDRRRPPFWVVCVSIV